MAPLVLHNVPDDELYVGKDGVTRPFAVVGAADERRSARLRRQATATHGSFGRARSRNRAGSVGPGSGARGRQAQPKAAATTTAADDLFGEWKKTQDEVQHQHGHGHDHAGADGQQDDLLDARRPGAERGRNLSGSSNAGTIIDDGQAAAAPSSQQQQQNTAFLHKHKPTEVILRGYRSADFQYAAIHHYEQIAGRICEDYPREPPVGSRRYRSSLRGAAALSAATIESNGQSALTPAERQAVMQRVAGGEHWVKVTFESAQAADAALYASPQSILGYLVAAELYRGVPVSAAEDVAVPDPDTLGGDSPEGRGHRGFGLFSTASSRTAESGTVTHEDPASASSRQAATASAASSSDTISANGSGVDTLVADGTVGTSLGASPPAPAASQDSEFCRRIPTARRATLKAPELALLPRESTVRQIAKRVPLVNRLTGTIIGNQVPRRDNGLFDWEKASLYWKLIWWLDFLFKLFGGEILDANKDD